MKYPVPHRSQDSKENMPHSAFRIRKTIDSTRIIIDEPQLENLIGKEVEIIILVEGDVNEGKKPSKSLQNSNHVAGSIILDEEAVKEMIQNRFK